MKNLPNNFFAYWEGFSAFDIPADIYPWRADEPFILKFKTPADSVTTSALYDTANNALWHLKELCSNFQSTVKRKHITNKAVEIAVSFAEYPNNLIKVPFCPGITNNANNLIKVFLPDITNNADPIIPIDPIDPFNPQAYVSHVHILECLNNVVTKNKFEVSDYYVLALMLIHEAIKTDGEYAAILAMESMQALGTAKGAFSIYSVEQMRQRKDKKKRSDAAKKGHKKIYNKATAFAMTLMADKLDKYPGKSDKWAAKQIIEQVNAYAKDEGVSPIKVKTICNNYSKEKRSLQ